MNITVDVMRKIRAVYRLTQAEFGALCDVSDAFINMIERGKRSMPEKLKRKIADTFELTDEKLARLLAIYEETKITA